MVCNNSCGFIIVNIAISEVKSMFHSEKLLFLDWIIQLHTLQVLSIESQGMEETIVPLLYEHTPKGPLWGVYFNIEWFVKI